MGRPPVAAPARSTPRRYDRLRSSAKIRTRIRGSTDVSWTESPQHGSVPAATDPPTNTYLLEYWAEDPDPEAMGVVRALEQAVRRLAAAGVKVRWLCSLVEPEQSRCMCFVAAADVVDVVRARDVASLPSARVALVVPLSQDGSPCGPSTTSDRR